MWMPVGVDPVAAAGRRSTPALLGGEGVAGAASIATSAGELLHDRVVGDDHRLLDQRRDRLRLHGAEHLRAGRRDAPRRR